MQTNNSKTQTPSKKVKRSHIQQQLQSTYSLYQDQSAHDSSVLESTKGPEQEHLAHSKIHLQKNLLHLQPPPPPPPHEKGFLPKLVPDIAPHQIGQFQAQPSAAFGQMHDRGYVEGEDQDEEPKRSTTAVHQQFNSVEEMNYYYSAQRAGGILQQQQQQQQQQQNTTTTATTAAREEPRVSGLTNPLSGSSSLQQILIPEGSEDKYNFYSKFRELYRYHPPPQMP